MKLTEIYRKYKTLKKYRKNSQEFIPKFFLHQASKGIVRRHRQKLPFLGISQKTLFLAFLAILAILGYTLILAIFGDPPKNPIFQDFPILAIFGHFPEIPIFGNFGYFGKSGILGDFPQSCKKGENCHFVKIEYTVKLAKMTDLGKNVKNRYFLTGSILTFFKGVERSPSGVNTDILSYTV